VISTGTRGVTTGRGREHTLAQGTKPLHTTELRGRFDDDEDLKRFLAAAHGRSRRERTLRPRAQCRSILTPSRSFTVAAAARKSRAQLLKDVYPCSPLSLSASCCEPRCRRTGRAEAHRSASADRRHDGLALRRGRHQCLRGRYCLSCRARPSPWAEGAQQRRVDRCNRGRPRRWTGDRQRSPLRGLPGLVVPSERGVAHPSW
jgi:hypothetical protein